MPHVIAAYFYPQEVTTGKAAVKTRYPLARKRSGKLVQNDRKVVVDVREGKSLHRQALYVPAHKPNLLQHTPALPKAER
jgi:hypothetical protein